MKQISILIAAFMLSAVVHSQKTAIDLYFSGYKSDPLFTKVEITGKMMELAGYIEAQNEEEQQMLDAVKKIEGISILAKDECADASAVFKAANSKVGSAFDELMAIQDNDGEIKIYISENNGVISELLVIAAGNSEVCIADVYGEIDLKTIRKVMNSMNVSGMDKVKDDMMSAAASIKLFPNPATGSQQVKLTFDEAVSGSVCMIFDSSGREVWRKKLSGTSAQLEVSNYSTGNFLVVVEKDGARIFSESLVIR